MYMLKKNLVSLSPHIVGEDFRFGFRREGDAKLLANIGKALGMEVKIVSMVKTLFI